jgi:hypothetical protein
MLVPQVKIITKGFREDGKYLSGEGDGEWLARVNQEYAEVYKTSNKLGLAKTQPVLTFDFVHGEYGNDRALIHYALSRKPSCKSSASREPLVLHASSVR